MRKVMLAAFLAFTYVLPESSSAAELKQNTAEAFNRYIRVTEARMAEELRDGQTFLWMDGFPDPKRDELYAQLRQGEIIIEQLETLETAKRSSVRNRPRFPHSALIPTNTWPSVPLCEVWSSIGA